MDVIRRNNVVVIGNPDGQPMMFAHGFGCDQHMWRMITPAFAETHRIVLFDHVGAGGSDLSAYDTDTYDDLQAYADDVIAVVEALELHDVIFVGHSVSAMIGVLAVNTAPQRFADLIMVSPSPRYTDDDGYTGGFTTAEIDELLQTLDSNYQGWSTAIAPVIMGNADRPELGHELTESFCRTDPLIARHFARVTFTSDNREDLPHVQVPALVIQCAHDVIAPVEVGRYVHEALPDSDLAVLDATGHCPHLSDPEETIAAMRAHLRGRGGAAQDGAAS